MNDILNKWRAAQKAQKVERDALRRTADLLAVDLVHADGAGL